VSTNCLSDKWFSSKRRNVDQFKCPFQKMRFPLNMIYPSRYHKRACDVIESRFSHFSMNSHRAFWGSFTRPISPCDFPVLKLFLAFEIVGFEWKRISNKQSDRWQHPPWLRVGAFFYLKKKCNNLNLGLVTPSSG